MIKIPRPHPEIPESIRGEPRYEPVPLPEEVERWIAVAYRRGLDDGLRAAEIRREVTEEEKRRRP